MSTRETNFHINFSVVMALSGKAVAGIEWSVVFIQCQTTSHQVLTLRTCGHVAVKTVYICIAQEAVLK